VLRGTVPIQANATDNVSVAAVQFRVDGNPVGADTSAPYSVNWSSSSVLPGLHVISAIATDAAGNQGLSQDVTVITTGL
jgi:hypothetical protein